MNWLDNFIEGVGMNARVIKWLGFIIVMIPTAWDIARLGILRFWEWRIYPAGIIVMILGALMTVFAERIRIWLVGE